MLLRTVRDTVTMATVSGSECSRKTKGLGGAVSWFLLLNPDHLTTPSSHWCLLFPLPLLLYSSFISSVPKSCYFPPQTSGHQIPFYTPKLLCALLPKPHTYGLQSTVLELLLLCPLFGDPEVLGNSYAQGGPLSMTGSWIQMPSPCASR